LEEADRASKASLATRQERADEMQLTAEKGDPLGAMLYTLGKANLRWPLWRKATVPVQDGWRKEILEEAAKGRRASTSNKARAQVSDDLLSLLFEHAVHSFGVPLGDLDTWAKRVFDASEAVNRKTTTVSAHRLQKFNVYPTSEYYLFQRALKASKLGPAEPLDKKNVAAMATWRREDNDFYLDYVLKTPFPIQQREKTPHPRSTERRILTAMYQRYYEKNKNKPEWLIRAHEPGLKKFFTVPGSGESSADD
jgi:hypothetical protein